MSVEQWSLIGTSWWRLVLALGAAACAGEPESSEVQPKDEVLDVGDTADVLGGASVDTRAATPKDAAAPTDASNTLLDAGGVLTDAAVPSEIYQVPDCAVWISKAEPADDGLRTTRGATSRP